MKMGNRRVLGVAFEERCAVVAEVRLAHVLPDRPLRFGFLQFERLDLETAGNAGNLYLAAWR